MYLYRPALYIASLLCLLPLRAAALPHPFTRLGAMDGLSDNQVQHILQLPDGRMAITTRGNINLYDGMRFRYIHRNDSDVCALPAYTGAYHVYVGESDRLWVKDWKRVFCLDLRSGTYVRHPDELLRTLGGGEAVNDLFIDSERGMWLVTPKGLRDVRRGSHVSLPPTAGTLQDVEVDGDRLYLFFSSGTLRCHELATQKLLYEAEAFNAGERPLFAGTSLVVKAPDGCFYQIRTGRRCALLAFSPADRSWTRLMDTDTLLHTLIVPDTRTAYVSCTHGIFAIDLHTGTHRLSPTIATQDEGEVDADFNTVYQDRDGGIWVGTANQGLYYAHPLRYSFRSAGTNKDAPRRAGEWKWFEGVRYNDVLTDSRGWTWAATTDGLRLFVPGESGHRTWYAEDGLSNNFVQAIAEDRRGRIWVSTSYGISRIEATSAHPDSLTFTSFRKEDGTLRGEYLRGEAHLLPDGHILMGGVDGVTRFHPDSVDIPAIALHPVLVGLTVNGLPTDTPHALPYAGRLEFSHEQDNLGFQFSALNYAWPRHTCYRYRLANGADTTWQTATWHWPGGMVDNTGCLHLSFALLPPGHYRLQVAASTCADGFFGKPREVEFVIHAPWWRTPAAYAAYAFLLVAAAGLGVWAYVRQSRLRIQRRHKEEILLLRIQNLIERCDSYERKEEEERAAAQPPEATISAADSEFLGKAVALVEQHLGTPGYSVEQLSRDLCMERSGLYKKLNALVDKSPSLFIRSIRLRRAAALIRQGGMSMAEIAEHVGFSSASYMGKCFQEEYGCKPSEYAARTKEST